MPEVTRVELPPGPVAEINWTVNEYIGFAVSRAPAGLTIEELRDRSKWPVEFEVEPITDAKLKVGDLLLVPSLGGGLFIGSVHASPEGSPYFLSQGGSLYGGLEYAQDERACWICNGLASLSAIERLELKR